MTTTTWPDPAQPGPHWLKGYTVDAWAFDGAGWWGPGHSHKLDPETVAARYSYIGPVLLPDEAAALQKRVAQLEAENAALRNNKNEEETLRQMMRDPRYWRHRDPELVNKVRNGFRKLVGGKDE